MYEKIFKDNNSTCICRTCSYIIAWCIAKTTYLDYNLKKAYNVTNHADTINLFMIMVHQIGMIMLELQQE